MKSIKYSFMLLTLMLTACASTMERSQSDNAPSGSFPILDVLPENIENFSYRGLHEYPDPWGYSLRYLYAKNKNVYADIYIYPVPAKNLAHEHRQIVDEVTEAALSEIEMVANSGAYTRYDVITSRSFTIAGRHLTRTDIYLVKHNIATYSLLFVTEKDGKLLKARMSMPDNEAHRQSEIWQTFIDKIFTEILSNIEKT